MLSTQTKRRTFIFIGYVVLFSAISFLMYYFFFPNASCFDHKKNQGEKGIDCGGPCSPCKLEFNGKDLVVNEKAFVPGGNNTYDVVAKISNPNELFGASSFHYTATLKDEAGNILSTKEGNEYILPADSKYVTQLGLTMTDNKTPTRMEFVVSDTKWAQLESIEKPQLNVYNRKFGPSVGTVGSEAEGLVRNESANDFKKIFIIVVLRDEKGTIVGVNTTQKDNVRAREERNFILNWPYAFPAPVRSMEVDVQTNVFDAQNFSTSIQ